MDLNLGAKLVKTVLKHHIWWYQHEYIEHDLCGHLLFNSFYDFHDIYSLSPGIGKKSQLISDDE